MAELHFVRKSGEIVTVYYDDGDPVIEPLAAAGRLSLAMNRNNLHVTRRDHVDGQRRLISLARIILGLTGKEIPRMLAVFRDGDPLNYRRANLVAAPPKGAQAPVELPKPARPAARPPTEYRPLTKTELAIAQRHRENVAAAIGEDVLEAWMADIEARQA